VHQADLNLRDPWQDLLPSNIQVCAGPLLADATPLTDRERRSAGGVDSERMRELESGRTYAKRSLSLLGIDNVELPVGTDRAPVWPNGVVGSLTHVRSRRGGYCAVAVGRSTDFRAIGIDVEYANSLAPGIWPQILTSLELQELLELPIAARALEVISRWCVKEAAAKAVRLPFEPLEIETERESEGSKHTTKWVVRSHGKNGLIGQCQGQTTRAGPFIFAAVVSKR
jgi:4'-phosphopantetheinyl transferase EntD